jgi:predicted nucleic acid-binding protein
MNIYVETNFVLELALMQEQYKSCGNIISDCQEGKINLVIPAYCLVEPYETLIRRTKTRQKLKEDIKTQLEELARSEPYKEEVAALKNDLTNLLAGSSDEDNERLREVLSRILSLAEVIPLAPNILTSAFEFESSLNLSPQDSIVYASVINHLNTTEADKNCFLNRNSRDFDMPDIVEALNNYGCKMLFSFNKGYSYIQSQIRE